MLWSAVYMDIIDRPSPNFNDRRHGAPPDMVVLHYTAVETADEALDILTDPDREVSAHYLIAADGRVFRLVDESNRAWHAGRGAWGGVRDVNSHSVGIELDNPGDRPFSPPLMVALEALLRQILARHSIDPRRVIGHSDMAPDRKQDPGPFFDWRHLAEKGLSVWPPNTTASVAAQDRFDRAARRFGYCAAHDLMLSAFRQRFRPDALAQPIDGLDVAMIEGLAARYPCLDPKLRIP